MKGENIAIILGRKGSKGFKNKNTMKILGRPAYEYAIRAAKKCSKIQSVYFSTDIDEIIKKRDYYDIEIINRPKYLANSTALFEDALHHAYKKIKKIHNNNINLVVILMANAVTVNSKLILKGIEMLENDKEADSAVTVSSFNIFQYCCCIYSRTK